MYLVGMPAGIWCFLYRADAPFPIFIGEVLSVFPVSLVALATCIFWLFVGHCPFGNKFLIIQKKKKKKKKEFITKKGNAPTNKEQNIEPKRLHDKRQMDSTSPKT